MQITLDQIIHFNPSSYDSKHTITQMNQSINLYFIVYLRRGLGHLSLSSVSFSRNCFSNLQYVLRMCMSVDVNAQRSEEDTG